MTDNFTVSSLASYNTQYLNAKNAYRELSALYQELNLDRKFKIDKKFKLIIPISRKYKVENCILLRRWEKIINFEKENPLKLSLPLVRKRIMYVYEQALVHLQFNADLWFSYFQFLLLSKKFNYAIRIMREAIEVYLPFDELLKLNFAYFFERHALINQAHFVYQLMLDFVFTHFLNFVKRNYDETIWRYYTGIVLSEKRCSQYVFYYCANMERTVFKNEKRAIYIMNEGYNKYASNKRFLLLYVKLLLEKGNIDEVRSLIYKFIHNVYADFYRKYDREHSSSGKKGSRAKSGQGEFNQFDSNYVKLLRKKNKACDKMWTLLMQLETLYGDITNLNRIWETKLKYESGYNLEENKNVLIDFDNVSNVNEHMFVEDSTLTDILCKGYLENLKRNDIDNLQFKVNLVNSQQFGGASLKKTFSFFQVSGENVFTELLTRNECVVKVQGVVRKKKKALRQEQEQKQEGDDPARPPKSQANKEHVSESDVSESRIANGNGSQNNRKRQGDADAINNDQLRNAPLKKEKKRSAKRGTVKSTYDSFNFLDSRTSNEESKTEEKTDMITDTVSSISRPNLKKMLLYKPLENYEHLEVDGGKLHDEKNISLSEYPYCISDMNRNDDRDYFFKREYFSMPNVINDFLSLLPEENADLNVSDNSIDYLITSLKNLTIPKLKTFPYEPIPVKEIIQIKNELNG
ncbi:hypothetical protein PCYB_101510 [Plasmodium cynomolgi strain B]|uniref:Suppressor of forked domain-containing protein n=1 Tax=Plasmodium cynomolgi (strain B) TaxID=1120755 RepID=K6UDL3_PLACD|nr:hypothetical protein PCYB_101510 [Plasmodium cynomolgi strain B]GAB66801.1 hypothetical protein PCYB_101510 [Plasmodium cynomolgi strain B]